jgi:uncharacterized OB-fold protein
MAESKFPDVNDPGTAPFWKGAKDGKVIVQACKKCGYLRWPPGPLCNECLSDETEWREVRPTGTLWSYAIYHRAMNPRFKDQIPYTVALVELDDGPRMYGRLVNSAGKIEPGMPVRAVLQEAEPGITVVNWEIATPR